MSLIPVYHISTYIGQRTLIQMPIDELVVELTKENTEQSYYELLNENVKLYFDIEKIPINEPDLINQIIKDLIDFFKKESNIDINKYCLTINKGTKTHNGLSYHLIFPEYYISSNYYLKCIVNKFIKLHYEYVNFVDGQVYARNRLFKCVNQYGFKGKPREGYTIDIEPIIIHNEQYFNKHELITGTIEESIINFIDNSKQLDFSFEQFPKLRYNKYIKKISEPDIMDVIRNRKEVGDKLFADIFTISLTKTNDEVAEFTKDLIKHYQTHDNTFIEYAIPLETLKIIIDNIKLQFNIKC